MNLARCKKGHYYDGDKYAGCPHCAQKNCVASNTVRMEDNVDAEQTEQKRSTEEKALKDAVLDALEKKRESEVEQVRVKKLADRKLFPVGILVEVNGNQAGTVHVLEMGCNYLGEHEELFSIANEPGQLMEVNATITYHEERNMFVLKPLGENSVVQVGRIVLRENIMLRAYDRIVVKECVLLFVPICGDCFRWE